MQECDLAEHSEIDIDPMSQVKTNTYQSTCRHLLWASNADRGERCAGGVWGPRKDPPELRQGKCTFGSSASPAWCLASSA